MKKSPFIERDVFIDNSYLILSKLENSFDQLKQYEERIKIIQMSENYDDSI